MVGFGVVRPDLRARIAAASRQRPAWPSGSAVCKPARRWSRKALKTQHGARRIFACSSCGRGLPANVTPAARFSGNSQRWRRRSQAFQSARAYPPSRAARQKIGIRRSAASMASRSPSASPVAAGGSECHQEDEIPGAAARAARSSSSAAFNRPSPAHGIRGSKAPWVLWLAPADLQPHFSPCPSGRVSELARGLRELFDGRGDRRKPSPWQMVFNTPKNGGPKPAVRGRESRFRT